MLRGVAAAAPSELFELTVFNALSHGSIRLRPLLSAFWSIILPKSRMLTLFKSDLSALVFTIESVGVAHF